VCALYFIKYILISYGVLGLIYKQHLFKEQIPLINRGMDAYSMRQKVIAENISNATSPGYRPEKVKFEEYFHDSGVVAIGSKTNEKHIPLGKKSVDEVEGEFSPANVPNAEVYFSGETNVNIDKEMSELAQNQIRFRFASKALRAYFTGLQTAIRGAVR
jgi:flagellar basal-body rod protein FlgB